LHQTCSLKQSYVVFESIVDPVGATVCYNRAVFFTGCAVLAEVGFGGGPRSLAESSRGWVPIQMVFYILLPFFRLGESVNDRGVGPPPVKIWERANNGGRIGCSFTSCFLNR